LAKRSRGFCSRSSSVMRAGSRSRGGPACLSGCRSDRFLPVVSPLLFPRSTHVRPQHAPTVMALQHLSTGLIRSCFFVCSRYSCHSFFRSGFCTQRSAVV
jgi:hypothetical protein